MEEERKNEIPADEILDLDGQNNKLILVSSEDESMSDLTDDDLDKIETDLM